MPLGAKNSAPVAAFKKHPYGTDVAFVVRAAIGAFNAFFTRVATTGLLASAESLATNANTFA